MAKGRYLLVISNNTDQNLTTPNLSTFHISTLLPRNLILWNPEPTLCSGILLHPLQGSLYRMDWLPNLSCWRCFQVQQIKGMGKRRMCGLSHQQELAETALKKGCPVFYVSNYVPHFLQLPHLTKLSNRSMFLRSLTNSPIIFLSNRGFSRSHWATSVLSIGMVRRPFSCRNWIPFFGFWLNCSVPVIRSWRRNTRVLKAALPLNQTKTG